MAEVWVVRGYKQLYKISTATNFSSHHNKDGRACKRYALHIDTGGRRVQIMAAWWRLIPTAVW